MQLGSYQFENVTDKIKEASYLAKRAQLRLDGFTDLLIRHGILQQSQVLEIGCGQGIRTALIAERFPNTEVLGIDRSKDLLAHAKKHYHHLPNLSFQLADIYALPFADYSFDFIYARLVFMHLNNPALALQNLQRLLRPGGKLLIEDADRDCMFFEPAPASFADFWQKVQAGQRRRGGDPNVGRKLAYYLKKAGFQNIQIDVQPIVGNGEDIGFLVETLLPSLNLYLLPEERSQGETAIQDLLQLAKEAQASFFHFWFVVSGEKEIKSSS